jgi:sugar (pentulose or hexulose) kinase
LIPAITWADTRAAAEAAELDARLTVAQKIAWWGAPMPEVAPVTMVTRCAKAMTDSI